MAAILSTRNDKRKRTGDGKEGKITLGIIVRVTVVSRYKFFLRIIIVHFNISQFIDMQFVTTPRIHEYRNTQTEENYATCKAKQKK
jgi:hypothetical protein